MTDHAKAQSELYPVIGESVDLGGIRWRVVDKDLSHVSFVVEGMGEQVRRVSLKQWQRVAERSKA